MYLNHRNDSGPRAVPIGHEPATTGLENPNLELLHCEHVLDRVETDGAFVVFDDALAPAERAGWHAAVRHSAQARGMDVAIRDTGSFVVLSDGMHSAQVDQIEQTLLDVIGEPVGGAETAQDADRSDPGRGRHLRLVEDAL